MVNYLDDLNAIRKDLEDISVLVGNAYPLGYNNSLPRFFYTSAHEILERILKVITHYVVGFTSVKHNITTYLSVLTGKHKLYPVIPPEGTKVLTLISSSPVLLDVASWNYNALRFSNDFLPLVSSVSVNDVVDELSRLLFVVATVVL